jgi:hypothetical protein
MDKDEICFVILMAPFVGSKVEESGGKRAKPKLMPVAAHGLRVLRIPAWRRRVPWAQNTCGPRRNFMAAPDALAYTCGTPRPAGFAGLGADALAKRREPRVSNQA